jgi:hypothetical protein
MASIESCIFFSGYKPSRRLFIKKDAARSARFCNTTKGTNFVYKKGKLNYAVVT